MLGQRNRQQGAQEQDTARNSLHCATHETAQGFSQIQFKDTGSRLQSAQIRLVSFTLPQIVKKKMTNYTSARLCFL